MSGPVACDPLVPYAAMWDGRASVEIQPNASLFCARGCVVELLKWLGALGLVFGAFYLMSAAGNEDRPQNTFGCAVMIFAAFIVVLIVKVLTSVI